MARDGTIVPAATFASFSLFISGHIKQSRKEEKLIHIRSNRDLKAGAGVVKSAPAWGRTAMIGSFERKRPANLEGGLIPRRGTCSGCREPGCRHLAGMLSGGLCACGVRDLQMESGRPSSALWIPHSNLNFIAWRELMCARPISSGKPFNNNL